MLRSTTAATTSTIKVTSMTMRMEGKPDVTGELSPTAKQLLFSVPQGATYSIVMIISTERRMKLRYKHAVKRSGITVHSADSYIGEVEGGEFERIGPPETAPKGFFVKGTYTVQSLLYSEDGESYEFSWLFQIQ